MTPQPKIEFLSLEDQIELRIRFKQIVKLEGIAGLLQAIGEINASAIVGLEIWEETLEEERKRLEKGRTEE